MEEVLAWGPWMWQEIKQDCEKRNRGNIVSNAEQFVKGGEYFKKAGGLFKNFLRKFLRKECKYIKIFGKEITLSYPVPAYLKNSMIKKLNKKYLNGSSKNSEFYKLYKIDDDTVIKRLGKPLKRGEDGIPIGGQIVKNGSFMRCFQAEIDKYKVKRYESLRVLCEDIRKTSKKNVGAIEIGMLPMDTSSF